MGNGNCVTAARKHFDQAERDGRVFAKQTAVGQKELETVRKALSLPGERYRPGSEPVRAGQAVTRTRKRRFPVDSEQDIQGLIRSPR